MGFALNRRSAPRHHRSQSTSFWVRPDGRCTTKLAFRGGSAPNHPHAESALATEILRSLHRDEPLRRAYVRRRWQSS